MKHKIASFILAISLIVLFGCKNDPASKQPEDNEKTYTFLVGTYTQKEGHVDGKGDGVYRVTLHPEKKAYQVTDTIKGFVNPSFLTVNKKESFAVVVNEVASDYPSGWLSLVDLDNGAILDTMHTLGYAPCHITWGEKGDIWYANYLGGIGSCTVENNQLVRQSFFDLPDTTLSTHFRQEASHPHSTILTQDGDYAYAADLGTDKIWIVKRANSDEAARIVGHFKMENGSGPRHMALSQHSEKLYVLNELDNSWVVFKINPENGSLILESDPIMTCPKTEPNTTADIHLSADDKYLYASNRGYDNIALFDLENGMLIGHYDAGGKTPRGFQLTRDGKYMLVASQDSDNIRVYRIEKGGIPVFVYDISINTPVCIVDVTFT